jgi:hypothetical protein
MNLEIPNIRPGDLVTVHTGELGLVISIYDHETLEPASADDAGEKLLAAVVEFASDTPTAAPRRDSWFYHELEPHLGSR